MADMTVKQIKDYTAQASLSGAESIPLQLATGVGYKTSPAQIADYTDAQKRGAILSDAALAAAQSQVYGVCDSAADASVKRFDLTNYSSADGTLPATMSIKWTHGNTVGDITASEPVYVDVSVYGSDGVYINNVRLADALGHYSGKKEAEGDIVDYKVTPDGEHFKARSVNTDIRQQDTNYVIYTDGSFVQYGNGQGAQDGTTSTQVQVSYAIPFGSIKTVNLAFMNSSAGGTDQLSGKIAYSTMSDTTGFTINIKNTYASSLNYRYRYEAIGTI